MSAAWVITFSNDCEQRFFLLDITWQLSSQRGRTTSACKIAVDPPSLRGCIKTAEFALKHKYARCEHKYVPSVPYTSISDQDTVINKKTDIHTQNRSSNKLCPTLLLEARRHHWIRDSRRPHPLGVASLWDFFTDCWFNHTVNVFAALCES